MKLTDNGACRAARIDISLWKQSIEHKLTWILWMKQNVETQGERGGAAMRCSWGDFIFLGNNVISCEITLYKDISGCRSCSNHPVCLTSRWYWREKRKTAFLPVQWYALERSNIGLMCATHCDHDMSWEKNLQVVWLVSRLINNNDYVKQDNRVINENPL